MIGFKGRPKTRAALIKEQLEFDRKKRLLEQGIVDLYPENNTKWDYAMKNFVQESHKHTFHNRYNEFQDNLMKELTMHSIYNGMVEPVLEEALADNHSKELAFRTVVDFIDEQNCFDLIRNWKYKNIYLAEMASLIENAYHYFIETAKDKLKEGLTDKDAYKIENDKIDDYIIDAKSIIPKDITNTISKRVEDSVNDFIADSQDRRDKILDIYKKAQDKIAANDPSSLIQDTPDEEMPNNEDPANMGDDENDPNMMPGNDNPNIQPDANPNEVQEAALWTAKRRERQIMQEGHIGVFGQMTQILTEAVLRIPVLQQTYLNEAGRVDMPKILGDVKSIYTVMETMNTLGVIDAIPTYINKTLNGMRESLDKISQDEKKYPTGQRKQPKEERAETGDQDNNPSNDFDTI